MRNPPFFLRSADSVGCSQLTRMRVDELRRAAGFEWNELSDAVFNNLPATDRGRGDDNAKENHRKRFYRTFKPGLSCPTTVQLHDLCVLAPALRVDMAVLLESDGVIPHTPSVSETNRASVYTAALLDVGHKVERHPRYDIAGTAVTFAVLPEATVRRVYQGIYSANTEAIEQFVSQANFVRRQFTQDLWGIAQRPKIVNWVQRDSFLSQFVSCPTEDITVMHEFISLLRSLIADSHCRFQIILTRSKLLDGIDTRLVAANRIVSERLRGSGSTEWSTHDTQISQAYDWFASLERCSERELLVNSHLDECCRILDRKK